MATQHEPITPRWIRPNDFIQETGMTRTEVYRALWDGRLKAVQVGRAWYIAREEIEGFFERAAKAA